MCVQTDVYTDVFMEAGRAASRWQSRGWGSHLFPREENALDDWTWFLKLPLSSLGEWVHRHSLPTFPHPIPNAHSHTQETPMHIHTLNRSKAWLLFAGRKPETKGLKATWGDLVCLQNLRWVCSSRCLYTGCGPKFTAPGCAVPTCVCALCFTHMYLYSGSHAHGQRVTMKRDKHPAPKPSLAVN